MSSVRLPLQLKMLELNPESAKALGHRKCVAFYIAPLHSDRIKLKEFQNALLLDGGHGVKLAVTGTLSHGTIHSNEILTHEIHKVIPINLSTLLIARDGTQNTYQIFHRDYDPEKSAPYRYHMYALGNAPVSSKNEVMERYLKLFPTPEFHSPWTITRIDKGMNGNDTTVLHVQIRHETEVQVFSGPLHTYLTYEPLI